MTTSGIANKGYNVLLTNIIVAVPGRKRMLFCDFIFEKITIKVLAYTLYYHCHYYLWWYMTALRLWLVLDCTYRRKVATDSCQ